MSNEIKYFITNSDNTINTRGMNEEEIFFIKVLISSWHKVEQTPRGTVHSYIRLGIIKDYMGYISLEDALKKIEAMTDIIIRYQLKRTKKKLCARYNMFTRFKWEGEEVNEDLYLVCSLLDGISLYILIDLFYDKSMVDKSRNKQNIFNTTFTQLG